jgi:MYXO-CTERM domain-containing protein
VVGTAIFVALVVAVLLGARRRRNADAVPEAGR